MAQYDLILKGGHVVDPSQGINKVQDIAFENGKVAKLDDDLSSSDAKEIKDVSKSFVVPGLIDLHTHVYWGGTSLGIDADDFCRHNGVTTAVDTGSAGPGNFAGFRKHVIEKSDVRILAYLHVSHAGVYAFSDRVMVGESKNLNLMDPITAVEVVNENKEFIEGTSSHFDNPILQFHGDETENDCIKYGLPYIKGISESTDGFENLDKKFPNTEAFIIDSHDDDGLGGTGKTFDWSKNKFETKKPIIIAGGLNCDNVEDAIKVFLPYGVDVSSGVELEDGKKDLNLIKKFIDKVKNEHESK